MFPSQLNIQQRKTVAAKNKLYFGDCLEVMTSLDDDGRPLVADESVDLVYLDPPFNSKANYNMIFGRGKDKQAQAKAFTDTWQWGGQGTLDVLDIERAVAHAAQKSIEGLHGVLGDSGMMAYLGYMAKRLAVVRKKMKPTASIYLHCDPTAGHYLKIVMDDIFGAKNFRNEITWVRRQEMHNLAQKHMGKIHDVIYFYVKSPKAVYRKQFLPYSEEYVAQNYKYKDEKGPYCLFPCTNEMGGNKPYTFRGITRAWRFEPKRMEEMFRNGLLVQLRPNSPFRYKKYLKDAAGVPLQDVWTDIPPVRGKESLGYPTQKPVALLKRIVAASSKKGDIVMDPFCGCGTTIAAAELLGRRWIGIDISATVIRIVTKARKELSGSKFEEFGIPKGMEEARKLAGNDRLQYESWQISTVPGLAPNNRKNQEGYDGLGRFLETTGGAAGKPPMRTITAEVKSSQGGVTAAQRNHLKAHVKQNQSAMGIFLTLKHDPATERWCKAQGDYHMPGSAKKYPKFQVYSAEYYFRGALPDIPPMLDPVTGKPVQEEFFSPK